MKRYFHWESCKILLTSQEFLSKHLIGGDWQKFYFETKKGETRELKRKTETGKLQEKKKM